MGERFKAKWLYKILIVIAAVLIVVGIVFAYNSYKYNKTFSRITNTVNAVVAGDEVYISRESTYKAEHNLEELQMYGDNDFYYELTDSEVSTVFTCIDDVEYSSVKDINSDDKRYYEETQSPCSTLDEAFVGIVADLVSLNVIDDYNLAIRDLEFEQKQDYTKVTFTDEFIKKYGEEYVWLKDVHYQVSKKQVVFVYAGEDDNFKIIIEDGKKITKPKV